MTTAREPTRTVACVDDYVDDYGAHYRPVFRNVRHVEQFTHLELGLLAETRPSASRYRAWRALPRLTSKRSTISW